MALYFTALGVRSFICFSTLRYSLHAIAAHTKRSLRNFFFLLFQSLSPSRSHQHEDGYRSSKIDEVLKGTIDKAFAFECFCCWPPAALPLDFYDSFNLMEKSFKQFALNAQ